MGLFGNKSTQKQKVKPDAEGRRDHFKRPGPPEARILKIGWLGLKAADPMALSLFIEQTLALPFVDEGNSTAGHHFRYHCGTLELELSGGGTTWATRPKPRQGQPDVPLIPSFKVDNIQQLAGQLHDREVPLTQVFEQGWTASFYFFDPERNLWQVHETRTDEATNVTTASFISTIWLAVEDFPAQVAFYRDVLGLPLVDEANRPRPITQEAEQYQQETPLPPEAPAGEAPGFADSVGELEQVTLDVPPSGDISSQGAVFFSEGARLALSPGGHRLEEGAPRVWGHDTPFLPGFQTNNLEGFVARLHAAGIKTTGPYSNIRGQHGHDRRHSHGSSHSAIRFHDPEGHCWQVYD